MRAPTKTELIHTLLRQGILTLQYRPGDYLNIDELARRHALSSIPVREAVARLAAERLVVMRPHVGAEVAPLDESSVREVFALLEGLETAAVDDIVERRTEADLGELQAQQTRFAALRLPRDLAEWDRLNAEFHLRLAAIAALPTLLAQLRVVFEHWDRVRRYFFEIAPALDASRAQREHQAMIHAVEAQDAVRLRRLVQQHNARARKIYLGLLAQSGAKPGKQTGK